MQVRCDTFPGPEGCQFIELENDYGEGVAGNWREDGTEVVLEIPNDIGLTAAQYHACIDKLWVALHRVGPQETDVFTLAAKRLKELEYEVEFNRALAEKAAEKCRTMPGPCWCGCHRSKAMDQPAAPEPPHAYLWGVYTNPTGPQVPQPYYELVYLVGGPEPTWGRTEFALLRPLDTCDLYVDGGHHEWTRTTRKFTNYEYNPPQIHTVFEYSRELTW